MPLLPLLLLLLLQRLELTLLLVTCEEGRGGGRRGEHLHAAPPWLELTFEIRLGFVWDSSPWAATAAPADCTAAAASAAARPTSARAVSSSIVR
jgi:hypothetical protein